MKYTRWLIDFVLNAVNKFSGIQIYLNCFNQYEKVTVAYIYTVIINPLIGKCYN